MGRGLTGLVAGQPMSSVKRSTRYESYIDSQMWLAFHIDFASDEIKKYIYLLTGKVRETLKK